MLNLQHLKFVCLYNSIFSNRFSGCNVFGVQPTDAIFLKPWDRAQKGYSQWADHHFTMADSRLLLVYIYCTSWGSPEMHLSYSSNSERACMIYMIARRHQTELCHTHPTSTWPVSTRVAVSIHSTVNKKHYFHVLRHTNKVICFLLASKVWCCAASEFRHVRLLLCVYFQAGWAPDAADRTHAQRKWMFLSFGIFPYAFIWPNIRVGKRVT